MKITKIEVIEIIENFMNDEGNVYDWDDFVSIPIDDDYLDSIRLECGNVHRKYPPAKGEGYCSSEGDIYLLSLIKKLRST